MNTPTELCSFNRHAKISAAIFRSINHPFRQQLISYLLENPCVNVTQLYTHFNCQQSVMSQQLGILRRTNFIKKEREQKHILYSVDIKQMQKVQNLMLFLLNKN